MSSEHPRSEERRDQLHGALQVLFYVLLGMIAFPLSSFLFHTIPI